MRIRTTKDVIEQAAHLGTLKACGTGGLVSGNFEPDKVEIREHEWHPDFAPPASDFLRPKKSKPEK